MFAAKVWVLVEAVWLASMMARMRSQVAEVWMDQRYCVALDVKAQRHRRFDGTHLLRWRGDPCDAWGYHLPRTESRRHAPSPGQNDDARARGGERVATLSKP